MKYLSGVFLKQRAGDCTCRVPTCSFHAGLVQDLVDQRLAILVLEGQDEGADLNQETVQLSLHTGACISQIILFKGHLHSQQYRPESLGVHGNEGQCLHWGQQSYIKY